MLTWVIYTSRCLFGSMVLLYLLIVKFFQLEGRVTSMMLGTKGFLNYDNSLPKVLENGGIASKCILRLVALGRSTVVDLASPPSDGLASSFRDLCASRR